MNGNEIIECVDQKWMSEWMRTRHFFFLMRVDSFPVQCNIGWITSTFIILVVFGKRVQLLLTPHPFERWIWGEATNDDSNDAVDLLNLCFKKKKWLKCFDADFYGFRNFSEQSKWLMDSPILANFYINVSSDWINHFLYIRKLVSNWKSFKRFSLWSMFLGVFLRFVRQKCKKYCCLTKIVSLKL